MRICFQAQLVADSRRHGYRRNTGRANEGIDGCVAKAVHKLCDQHTGGCAHAKGKNAQTQNTQRIDIQKLARDQL